MVSASSWSWVTKTAVVPSSRSRRRSSICMVSRSLRSSAEKGSSSSSSLGSHRERARDRDALLLAARQRAHRAVGEVGEMHQLEEAPARVGAISPAARRRAFRPKATFSATVRCGKQRVVLEHDADVAPVRRLGA